MIVGRWTITPFLALFLMSVAASSFGADTGEGEIHVVVSHYGGKAKHAHHVEVEAAIAANLANPAIASMHVVYEPGPGDGCHELKKRVHGLLHAHWPSGWAPSAQALGCTETPTAARATLQEMVALYPERIFGERAREEDRKVVVVVVNGDIVLDASVRRLGSLRAGHAAVLSVNTGPAMEDCCLEAFQDNVAAELKLRREIAQGAVRAGMPRAVNCTAGRGPGGACLSALPAAGRVGGGQMDEGAHVLQLRAFYASHRRAVSAVATTAGSSDAEGTWFSAGRCGLAKWSTNGWQFCGSPSGKMHDIAVSWDGYALVLPLPVPLLEPGNPWFDGIPRPLDPDWEPVRGLNNAYAPTGKVRLCMVVDLGVLVGTSDPPHAVFAQAYSRMDALVLTALAFVMRFYNNRSLARCT